jgi:primosomal protein N' (replication factor Y)
VERAVGEFFPQARIARMDVDTTSGKWSHHRILGRFERGEVDILLGTQMIAKGLDFPRVTLVGVINADVGIHLPDFRASERTFQLLSQVAGRTGRGPLGGEVVVQTALPGHYTVRAALDHDFHAFAERELEERRSPAYPPLTRLANIVFSSPLAEEAAREAERGGRWLGRRLAGARDGCELVGPAPSPIEQLHGRWRWHFLLRAPSARVLGRRLSEFRAGFRPRGRDVRLILDRDPVSLL